MTLKKIVISSGMVSGVSGWTDRDSSGGRNGGIWLLPMAW